MGVENAAMWQPGCGVVGSSCGHIGLKQEVIHACMHGSCEHGWTAAKTQEAMYGMQLLVPQSLQLLRKEQH